MLLAEATAITSGYIALARLQQARGDSAGAIATFYELEVLARERNFPAHLLARAAALQAQLALMQGDLKQAVHWIDTSGLHPDRDLSYPREVEYLTLARVRIAQGRGDPAGPYLHDALQLLDRLLEADEAGGRMESVIEILILRALALQAQGDMRAALTALERALTLAAPEGYVRVFVDEGAPMAALLSEAQHAGIAPTTSPRSLLPCRGLTSALPLTQPRATHRFPTTQSSVPSASSGQALSPQH
jgi:LuxR family maltose regulon positive regulatory protein